MIDKKLFERIAAEVSGDLAPAEVEALRQDLVKSPEARKLYRALKQDQKSLQNLPRRQVGHDLSPKVLAELAERSPFIPLPKQPVESQLSRWPQFIGLALGLGLALLGGWLVSIRDPQKHAELHRQPNVDVVARPPEIPPNGNLPQVPAPLPVVVDRTDRQSRSDPVSPPQKPPIKPPSDVLTAAPDVPIKPVQVIKPRTSLPLVASDLMTKEPLDSFWKELSSDDNHRLEFFSADTNRLMEDIVKVSRTKKTQLVFEPLAHEFVRRKVKSGFSIYVETWSNEDALAVIKTLAKDNLFQTMVLTPITEGDRRELKNLLGRDPMESSEPAGKSGRPSADKSAEGNAQALERGGKAMATGNGPVGYVSLFPLPKTGQMSKEQQVFWDRRIERLPGKLRVYLILRPLS